MSDAVEEFQKDITKAIDKATNAGLHPILNITGLLKVGDGTALINVMNTKEKTYLEMLGSALTTILQEYPEEFNKSVELIKLQARLLTPIDPVYVANLLKVFIEVIVRNYKPNHDDSSDKLQLVMAVSDILNEAMRTSVALLQKHEDDFIVSKLSKN